MNFNATLPNLDESKEKLHKVVGSNSNLVIPYGKTGYIANGI